MPGQTARHPEGWFDPLKTVNTDPFDSPAMRAGLDYLHAGYFWECHEVLEAVWLALPDPSSERHMVQAVIQLANARLKLAMVGPRPRCVCAPWCRNIWSQAAPVARFPVRRQPNCWNGPRMLRNWPLKSLMVNYNAIYTQYRA